MVIPLLVLVLHATPGNSITDWQDIRKAYSRQEDVPLFTHGQMVTYFVTRTVSDGLPAKDFKGMNEKPLIRFITT